MRQKHSYYYFAFNQSYSGLDWSGFNFFGSGLGLKNFTVRSSLVTSIAMLFCSLQTIQNSTLA